MRRALLVCHQEAMCDDDMPAVYQYFTKVSSLSVSTVESHLSIYSIFLRIHLKVDLLSLSPLASEAHRVSSRNQFYCQFLKQC